MNGRRILTIFILITFIISFGYGYGNAIIALEDTDSVTGVVDEINTEDNSLTIDGKHYFFKDESAMKMFMEKSRISDNSEVTVSYNKGKGKNFIVHIKIKTKKTKSKSVNANKILRTK